jgi:hypothetical protein
MDTVLAPTLEAQSAAAAVAVAAVSMETLPFFDFYSFLSEGEDYICHSYRLEWNTDHFACPPLSAASKLHGQLLRYMAH